jgi:hypothetical protein
MRSGLTGQVQQLDRRITGSLKQRALQGLGEEIIRNGNAACTIKGSVEVLAFNPTGAHFPRGGPFVWARRGKKRPNQMLCSRDGELTEVLEEMGRTEADP